MRKTNKGKVKAKEFLGIYGTSEYSSERFKDILEEKGYTTVEFGSSSESDTLISELKLKNYADSSRGFTYADSNYRIVFIDENLSEDEKRIVLTHEAGHIFCEHFGKASIIGKDVTDEFEANEFAHYILIPTVADTLKDFIKRNRIKIFFCMVLLAIISILTAFAINRYRDNKYYGDYYITATGTKYHTKDCRYIDNKESKSRMTNEEFESGYYDPCSDCLPDELLKKMLG